MEEVIRKMSEQWFLREPAFFALYCLQKVSANTKIQCPVRCGQGKIEYNPDLLRRRPTREIERLFRIELIRLFLKHPYERQPDGVSPMAMAYGSDVTIADGYNTQNERLPLNTPKDFNLDSEMSFEWYSRKIEELIDGDDLPEAVTSTPSEDGDALGDESEDGQRADGQSAASDKAGLWEEDDMKAQEVNDLIQSINNWGSIPGEMVQKIEASAKARIDYRKIVQGFRGSILSTKTKLTRMKPNRRTGFQQMGTARKFSTKLLVAVDVSGSIDDITLSNFYGVINRMFKYGIDEIDCVQFDTQMGEVKPLRKASKKVEVKGRGGTYFQPVFDYIKENTYDGLVILTDGYAEHPTMDDNNKTNILWVLDSEKNYEAHKEWMRLYGRVCWMILN